MRLGVQINGTAAFRIEGYFFNIKVATWEPFLEPWEGFRAGQAACEVPDACKIRSSRANFSERSLVARPDST